MEGEIRNLAHSLATKHGPYSGNKNDDWYEAENLVRKQIVEGCSSLREMYRYYMIDFFRVTPDALTSAPSNAAKQFLLFMERHWDERAKFQREQLSSNDFQNVSVATIDNDLDFLTRRAIVLADSTLLSHGGEAMVEYRTSTDKHGLTIDPAIYIDHHYYTNCSDRFSAGDCSA